MTYFDLSEKERDTVESKYKERVSAAGKVQDIELDRFYKENPGILEQQIILG